MSKGLQTLNNQNKLAEWAERVADRRNSGMSVSAWCKANGVCEQTYYKWQKRLYDMAKAQQESKFAEVTPVGVIHSNGQIAVTVRSTGVVADIHIGADADTLETVLRLLKLC